MRDVGFGCTKARKMRWDAARERREGRWGARRSRLGLRSNSLSRVFGFQLRQKPDFSGHNALET
jgi:hypothetical protein